MSRRLLPFFFLIAASLALFASPEAFAGDTRSAAKAKCEADVNSIRPAIGSGAARCRDTPDPVIPNKGFWVCEFTNPNDNPIVWYNCGSGFGLASGHPYDTPDQTCESLNNNPETAPGPRLCLAQDCVPRCTGGCALDVVGDPLQTVPGRVQGQPVVYYRFAQAYTGETCDPNAPPDDTDFEPQPDGKECVPEKGICVKPDGSNEYCTFNPDGTPNVCVPAVDYDNDGTPDDDDVAPGDPTNGDDEGEGDETDNSASGGASCASPPSCAGDGIACATLYQTWKTRCAVEALGESSGGVVGPGTGDDCPTWDANCNGIPDSTEQPYDEAQAGNIGDAVVEDDGQAAFDLINGAGFLGGASCPGIGTATYMGRTLNVNDTVCELGSAFGALVLVIAYAMAAGIVARAASGA